MSPLPAPSSRPALPHHFFRERTEGRSVPLDESKDMEVDLKNKFVCCGTATPPSLCGSVHWTRAARGARRRRPCGGRHSSSIHAERDSSCGVRLLVRSATPQEFATPRLHHAQLLLVRHAPRLVLLLLGDCACKGTQGWRCRARVRPPQRSAAQRTRCSSVPHAAAA